MDTSPIPSTITNLSSGQFVDPSSISSSLSLPVVNLPSTSTNHNFDTDSTIAPNLTTEISSSAAITTTPNRHTMDIITLTSPNAPPSTSINHNFDPVTTIFENNNVELQTTTTTTTPPPELLSTDSPSKIKATSVHIQKININ